MNREEAKKILRKPPYENSGFEMITKGDANKIIDKIYDYFEKKFEIEQNTNLEDEKSKRIIIESLRKENIRLKKHIIKKRCCQDCKNYLSGFQSDVLLWENCKLDYQCSNIFDNHFEEREKGCFDVI